MTHIANYANDVDFGKTFGKFSKSTISKRDEEAAIERYNGGILLESQSTGNLTTYVMANQSCPIDIILMSALAN